MKIYFMKQDAISFFKINMGRLYANYYQKDDNSWMEEEYGDNPFVFFMDMPDFELAPLADGMKAGEIDVLNCKIIYENLKDLSESQASDERLWAGLCNGTFYKYMRRRHGYNKGSLNEKDASTTALSRFFFSGGQRAGFYRNTLAKCWWVGRATYDSKNQMNHFDLLDALGANDISTKVSDIFYSNTFAASQTILKGICDSLRFYSDRDVKLRMREEIRPALQYLNAVGVATLLDVLTAEEIKDLMVKRISELRKGESDDIRTTDEEIDSVDDEEEIADIQEEIDETIVETEEDDDSYEDSDIAEEDDEQDTEELIEKPGAITWGCYFIVHKEKDDSMVTYHIPLERELDRNLYLIEKRMMGKTEGFRIYLAGSWYEVTEYGWD